MFLVNSTFSTINMTHFFLPLQAISKNVQECIGRANQVAMETFSNMKTVRCFANEDGEIKRYEQKLDAIYALNKTEAFAYAVSTWADSVSPPLRRDSNDPRLASVE